MKKRGLFPAFLARAGGRRCKSTEAGPMLPGQNRSFFEALGRYSQPVRYPPQSA
jgi:hypothetical protein